MQHRKCWAFLVGINEYHDYATLRYCVDDVRALSTLLDQIGYVPICLHDRLDPRNEPFPNRHNIETELETLLEKVTEDDLLLVYFACHGVRTSDHKPMLVVSETRKRKLKDTAISIVDYLEPKIRACPAKQKLLMLDACFIGSGRGERDPADYLRRVSELTSGFAILSASTERQEALESSDLKHSIFCHFLLKGLAGAAVMGQQDVVMLSMLQNYIRAEIDEYTTRHGNFIQVPQHRSEGDAGDFMLADYQGKTFPDLDAVLNADETTVARSQNFTGRGQSAAGQVDNSLVARVIDSLWDLNYEQQRQCFQQQITNMTGGAVIAVQAETPQLQLWLAKRLFYGLPKPEVNIYNKRCIISAKKAVENFDLVWDEVWKSLHKDSRHVAPYQNTQDVLNKIVDAYQKDTNIIIFVENWYPNVRERREKEARVFLQKLIQDFWQPLRQQVADKNVDPLYGRLILCLMDVKGSKGNLGDLSMLPSSVGLIDLKPLNIPSGDLKTWALRNPVLKTVDQSKVRKFLADFSKPASLQESEIVIDDICYLCGLDDGIGDLVNNNDWDKAEWRLAG